MEELLLKKYSASSTGYTHPNYNKEKVHLCRYADDFIVTAENRETLLEIQQAIEKLDLDKNFYIGRKINPGNYDVQYDIEQYIKEYVKRRK